MRKKQPERTPLPPKTFTICSLVGMTMGARKRAWEMMGYLRSDLRIGKRLRPCPGCPECEHGKCWRCDNCGTTKGLCDLTLADVRCKCGKGCGQWRISFPATTVCDGSRVLPARKEKS